MSHDYLSVVALLSRNTFTVADMERRVALVRECIETVVYSDQSPFSTAALMTCLTKQGTMSDVVAITAWGDALSPFYVPGAAAQFAELQSVIATLPVLTLYVPVLLPESEQALLGEHCRTMCDPTILLDIQIDPQAVGGCSFVWKDTLYDFSFRAQLAKQPGVITALLSAYA